MVTGLSVYLSFNYQVYICELVFIAIFEFEV